MNILPSYVYEQLGGGNLKPSPVILQVADQSLKTPWGILEDVLIRVEDFFFPVDFLVLDTDPTNKPTKPSIILGRPFLATSHASINCNTGALKMGFGNRKIRLNVFDAYKQAGLEDCSQVEVIDDLIEEATPAMLCDDPLQHVMLNEHFHLLEEREGDVLELEELLGVSTESLSPSYLPKVDQLPEMGTFIMKPSTIQGP